MTPRTTLIVVPDHAWPDGGNAVTARRIALELDAAAGRVEPVPLAGLERRLAEGDVGLLHALHVRRSGIAVAEAAERFGVPFVVTVSGTDLYQDLTPPAGRPDVANVLARASAVTVFHEAAARLACSAVPSLRPKLHVIPPSMVPLAGTAQRGAFGIPADAFVFLLPAGLRPVKRPLFALPALRRLQAEGHPVFWVIAGPGIDADVTAEVREAARALPWLSWLGHVPHERMGALYQSCDVVLNTSTAEGLSNAVLEGMAARKPVLASRNDGNLAALGEQGMFFDDEEGLYQAALRARTEPLLRKRLVEDAWERVVRLFSPAAEGAAYARLYGSVLESGAREECQGGR